MAKAEKKREIICLNMQTAGNMIKYLQRFPADAKMVIHTTDKNGVYRNYDCQIGCNFDYQEEANTVIVFPSIILS